MKKLSQEEFIKRLEEIFKGELLFTNTLYSGCKELVEVLCPNCGPIQKRADKLLRGTGCPVCREKQCRISKRSNTEKFIDRVRKEKLENYDCSRVVYVNSKTKVILGCEKHSWFEIAPATLFQGSGCPQCSYDKNGLKC